MGTQVSTVVTPSTPALPPHPPSHAADGGSGAGAGGVSASEPTPGASASASAATPAPGPAGALLKAEGGPGATPAPVATPHLPTSEGLGGGSGAPSGSGLNASASAAAAAAAAKEPKPYALVYTTNEDGSRTPYQVRPVLTLVLCVVWCGVVCVSFFWGGGAREWHSKLAFLGGRVGDVFCSHRCCAVGHPGCFHCLSVYLFVRVGVCTVVWWWWWRGLRVWGLLVFLGRCTHVFAPRHTRPTACSGHTALRTSASLPLPSSCVYSVFVDACMHASIAFSLPPPPPQPCVCVMRTCYCM